MTSAAIIAICAFGVVAFLVVAYSIYSSNKQTARGDALAATEEQAVRAQTVAEQTRDQEHVARVAAEAARDDLAKQLLATQAELNASAKELETHVGDLIRNGATADGIAAFKRLLAQLSASPAKPDTATRSDGTAPAVHAAGPAGAAKVG